FKCVFFRVNRCKFNRSFASRVLLLIKILDMRLLCIFLVLAVQQLSAADFFWGKTGHRVVGEVAEQHIKKRTLKKIHEILDGQSLSVVANFGDDIKSDPRYREFGAWHYVNLAP